MGPQGIPGWPLTNGVVWQVYRIPLRETDHSRKGPPFRSILGNELSQGEAETIYFREGSRTARGTSGSRSEPLHIAAVILARILWTIFAGQSISPGLKLARMPKRRAFLRNEIIKRDILEGDDAQRLNSGTSGHRAHKKGTADSLSL